MSNEKKSLTRRIVIVDIDETLVYSRSRKPLPGYTTFKDPTDGYMCHTVARPGAAEFLATLREEFEVVSLTQGVVPFQEMVLDSLGLLKYFQDEVPQQYTRIYGWLNNSRTTNSVPDLDDAKWVLVDNLHHQDRTLADKQWWINNALREAGREQENFDPTKNFVKVQEFLGGNDVYREKHIKPLTQYIKKVKDLLC